MLKLRSWSALGFQEFPDRLAAFATKGDRHAEAAARMRTMRVMELLDVLHEK